MKLLLSNDDGVLAEGISALARELKKEYEVFIAAPDTERSCVSRAMTLLSPLRARAHSLPGLEEVPAYGISGTPVDCVRLGLGNLFSEAKMVVSGINHGPNLGSDALYSGTVAAAHEAAMLGYQAVAVSSCSYAPKHFDTAARYAARAVQYLQKNPLPFGVVLNVNVPDLPMEEIRGIKIVPGAKIDYQLEFIEAADPKGTPCYWPPRARIPGDLTGDTDERWAMEGYVTLTPLGYDLTNYETLARMRAEER